MSLLGCDRPPEPPGERASIERHAIGVIVVDEEVESDLAVCRSGRNGPRF